MLKEVSLHASLLLRSGLREQTGLRSGDYLHKAKKQVLISNDVDTIERRRGYSAKRSSQKAGVIKLAFCVYHHLQRIQCAVSAFQEDCLLDWYLAIDL